MNKNYLVLLIIISAIIIYNCCSTKTQPINKKKVRGNHYHKKTTQWNYLISGKVMFVSKNNGKKNIKEYLNRRVEDNYVSNNYKDRVKTIFKKTKNKKLSIANVNGVNLVHFFNSRDRSGWVDGKFDIDVEYLEILRDSGFDQIVFPVESAAKRILKLYATNKVNLDRMHLPLLMKKMTDLGIQAPVNMMIGFPDETEEEINMSIDFAKILMDNGAPYVTFFVPIPFPGSNLYNIAINGDYLDKNFDTDKMNWKNPVMKNTTVSPEKLIEIT